MLVKDIIKLVCKFTENEELEEAIEENSLTDEQTLLVESLVNGFNLVNNEIASEYLPYLKSKSMQTDNFKIKYSDFDEKLCEIISIKDKNGKNLKFKKFDDHIMVFANSVQVIYSIYPQNLTLEDEFESLLPERVYAYGVAREYFFIKTLFDDADIWEERFKNSLQVLVRKKSDIIMPRRRWI